MGFFNDTEHKFHGQKSNHFFEIYCCENGSFLKIFRQCKFFEYDLFRKIFEIYKIPFSISNLPSWEEGTENKFENL